MTYLDHTEVGCMQMPHQVQLVLPCTAVWVLCCGATLAPLSTSIRERSASMVRTIGALADLSSCSFTFDLAFSDRALRIQPRCMHLRRSGGFYPGIRARVPPCALLQRQKALNVLRTECKFLPRYPRTSTCSECTEWDDNGALWIIQVGNV